MKLLAKNNLQIIINLISIRNYCVTMYNAKVSKETYYTLQAKVADIDGILLKIISEADFHPNMLD